MASVRVLGLESRLGLRLAPRHKLVHPKHLLVDLTPHVVRHVHLVLLELLHVLGVQAKGDYLVGVCTQPRGDQSVLLGGEHNADRAVRQQVSPVQKELGHRRVVLELFDVAHHVVQYNQHVHLPRVHVIVGDKALEDVVHLVCILLDLLDSLLKVLALLGLALGDALLCGLGDEGRREGRHRGLGSVKNATTHLPADRALQLGHLRRAVHVHAAHELFLQRQVLRALLRAKEDGLGELSVHLPWTD